MSWINRQLPKGFKPTFQRPLNYLRMVTVTTLVLGVLSVVSIAYPYILPIIQNRNVWAGISLITILLFTSGHMFNHIRKVPYVAGDGKGGISYFAGGFSNQFGMETQIVAAMCKPFQDEELGQRNSLIRVRRHTCFCDYSSRDQGPSNSGSEDSANFCLHMGRNDAGYV